MSRSTALLGALFLTLIAAYGLWRLSVEYPRHWAMVIPYGSQAESPRLAIASALEGMTNEDGTPVAGSNVPLARFVASNGEQIRLNVVEGQFYDRSIEPHTSWQTLGTDLMLVSSVDEARSARGSLGEATNHGCKVTPTPNTIQALGESSITPCGGVYGQHFGITWLARLSVIVDDNSGTEESPCWIRFGLLLPDNGYQDCVRKALAGSLSHLFVSLDDGRYRPLKAVVFPPIATGTGALSTAALYDELLVNTVVPELARGAVPPLTIYLQVSRYDSPQRWKETKAAIAGAVATAASKWETTDHKIPSSEWLSLTGVSLGGALVLFGFTLGFPGGAFRSGFSDLVGTTPLSLVAWIATAVGVASMFTALVSLAPTSYGPYAQVGAGVVAALLAGPLTRASAQAQDVLKGKPVITPGDRNASE
jgi:hypothetical protein